MKFNLFTSWLNIGCAAPAPASDRPKPSASRRRPRLEELEARVVLSAKTVAAVGVPDVPMDRARPLAAATEVAGRAGHHAESSVQGHIRRGQAGPETGLTIHPLFDSSITSDGNAAEIERVIERTCAEYKQLITTPIDVYILFGDNPQILLAQNYEAVSQVSYGQFWLKLKQHSTSAADRIAVANLPYNNGNNPVTQKTSLFVSNPVCKALGLPYNANYFGPVDNQRIDGIVRVNLAVTDPASRGDGGYRPKFYDLKTTLLHEIDEVLGLASPVTGDLPREWNLFRYGANGQRSYTSNPDAQAFFSLDGEDRLAQFNQSGHGSDYGDWKSNPLPPGTPERVQDAHVSVGRKPLALAPVELTALDVIGYTLRNPGREKL